MRTSQQRCCLGASPPLLFRQGFRHALNDAAEADKLCAAMAAPGWWLREHG